MENKLPSISTLIIPDELKGPLPRKVRLMSSGLTAYILAYGLLALGITLVLWVSVNASRKMQYQIELHSEGRETVGEIIRYWSSGRSANWYISYSLIVDGVPYRGEARVPDNTLNSLGISLNEHSTLSILYLPTNPSVNYPAGWNQSYISSLISFIPSIGMVIIGIGLLLFFRQERQLIKGGVPSIGVITNIIRGKGRTGDAMYYEFRLDDGRIMNGCSPWDGVPDNGTSICILYLPQNPQRNRRYPLRYYRVA